MTLTKSFFSVERQSFFAAASQNNLKPFLKKTDYATIFVFIVQ